YNEEHADLILRSSDNIEFRVYRGILYILSPVLKDLITQKLAEHPTLDDVPLISVPESNSSVLDTFLRICYPGPNPVHLPPTELYHLIHAAEKYQVHAVSHWGWERLLQATADDPVGTYAVACHLEWVADALSCAK
ncbi:hypothetical protein PUNSTDRAFT_19161, partial [Punctularia strigosozonata HHB-11173 SS5]